MPTVRQVMSPKRAKPILRESDKEVAESSHSEGSRSDDESSDDSSSSSESSASSSVASARSSSSCDEFDDGESDNTNASGSSRAKKGSSKKRRSSKSKHTKKRKSSKKHKRARSDLRDTPSLEIPKLTGADDYELRRTMVELKLKVLKLWSLVTKEEVLHDSWRSSKKRRWQGSWLKAQAVIAGSLGPRLAGRYRRLLVNCDPVVLFQEIEKEYNAGSAAKNDILVKAAMFVRKLAKQERVNTYIDSIMKLQEDLVTLGHPIDEPELARLLLTNALEVFPDLSTELVAARMKGDTLEVGKVRGRLLAREQEETMRGFRHDSTQHVSGSTNSTEPHRDSTPVFQLASAQNYSRGGSRGHHGGHQSNRNRSNHSRRTSIQEAMQRRPCGKLGHWHRDCRQSQAQGDRGRSRYERFGDVQASSAKKDYLRQVVRILRQAQRR